MTRVKICGLTRPQDVGVAVRAGADAIGAIVDVPVDTPRAVSEARASTLFDQLPPFVTGVLVTMGDDPDAIAALADRVGADAIQIHEGLPPGDVSYLAAKMDGPVLAAVDADDPGQARDYAPVADALVVDSADADGAGGTGRTHDWEQTAALVTEVSAPVVLAGGLTPDNVAQAIRTVDPFAVDVASGVEVADGRKDHALIEDFLAASAGVQATP